MSEASPDRKLGPLRHLCEEELAIVRKMISATPLQQELDRQISDALVQDMPDGGIGSIKFYSGRPRAESEYGKLIAEAAFQDGDGVPVSATLSLDKSGYVFELDMFKADGSPLMRYPNLDDFKIIKRHGKLGYAPQQS